MILENIPRALRDRKQWVLWRWNHDKTAKVPLVRESQDRLAGSDWNTYPQRWTIFDDAVAMLARKRWQVRDLDKEHQRNFPHEPPRYKSYSVELSGIGVALSYDVNPPNQILVAFDIDDHTPDHRLELVRDGQIINVFAQSLVERLNSYTEVTPSGYGLRVLCLVPSLPPKISRTITDAAYHNLGFQIFVGSKFITVSGNHVAGTPRNIEWADLNNLVGELTFPVKTPGGQTPHRILRNARHEFLKKKAAQAIKACWMTDRDLLINLLKYLRDTWCEAPEEKTNKEVQLIADWALLKCSPNPLWQGNDNYIASTLFASDPKYAAAWRVDLAPFDGDANVAFEYVTDKLLAACRNDADQVTRIFAVSPLRPVWEQQLPAHLRDAGAEP